MVLFLIIWNDIGHVKSVKTAKSEFLCQFSFTFRSTYYNVIGAFLWPLDCYVQKKMLGCIVFMSGNGALC